MAAGRATAVRIAGVARETEQPPAKRMGLGAGPPHESSDRMKNVADAPTLLASVTRAPPPPARWSPRRGVWVSVGGVAGDPIEEERKQLYNPPVPLDVWKSLDPVLPKGTQPKSRAPCPPAEQVMKQRKRAIEADECQDSARGDE